MILTRQQRERLVLDLYNQGKNTREIAEEARMSFSAIGAILKKAEKENETSKEQTEKLSQAAHAYKLFSEGKSPEQVAIELNLRQPQVTELYIEHWKLKQLYNLNQVYDEIKDDIYPFVKLYMLSKVARMDTQHVIRLLTLANDDLPAVEYRYERLKREEGSLQARNHNSARTFQELSDLISTTRNTLEQYELSCKERGLEIKTLNKEYTALQELVNNFQNNNEEFIKIIKAVEDRVVSVLSNAKVLLRCTLLSITESITNNSERFRLIFYNMPSIIDCYNTNGQDYTDSYTYGQMQQQPQYLSPDNNTEANAAIMVGEAEKLFNKLVKDCINKTITDHTFSKSSLPLLPTSNEEQKSCKIKSNSS
jgi:hypothetical protein